MAQVLYRKYRSKSLSEIVGQEHITKTLSEALKTGRISHAYLFTGPKGVGKTSVARILAHEVNKLPYTDDQPHIDIIEIDAASNRRIDEVRDLREKVHTLPAAATYKVYIIDEVHMLTKEAFNALLKTLEEPPAHVIFILATTDASKLPDTIISRTQRFSFKPIDKNQAIKHLKDIATKEKIEINDQALELIAEHGDGSFRDSISLLDQLGGSPKPLTEDDVTQMLGIPPKQAIDKLVELIEQPQGSYKAISNELSSLEDQGFTPSQLAKRLMNDLRQKLVDYQLTMPTDKAIGLLKELLNVESASDSSAFLLLTLLAQTSIDSDHTLAPAPTAKAPDPPKSETKAVITDVKPKPTSKQVSNVDIWPSVLNELKNRYNTLYGIVRMAEPKFKTGNKLDLIFDFAFHQKQVSENKNKLLLTGILKDLTGKEYVVECFLNEDGPKPEATNDSNPDLDNIAKIFGGGELVD